jgi:hypothetical protein
MQERASALRSTWQFAWINASRTDGYANWVHEVDPIDAEKQALLQHLREASKRRRKKQSPPPSAAWHDRATGAGYSGDRVMQLHPAKSLELRAHDASLGERAHPSP